jgi:transketolase
MRRAFAKALCGAAEKDPDLMFLTGDMGFQVFDEFVSKFNQRYINVGIAEAQMVAMASGLAKEGFRPVIYSIASFMTARPFEQIRVCVSYPGLPVLIVGAGGGYAYSASGVTHHAGDDLALMSLLPGMTVVAPCDPPEITALLPQLLALKGPAYLRVGMFGEPEVPAAEPPVLGKARLLAQGEKAAIVTTGDLAVVALEAVQELNREGISPSLYHFHTVKPLDTGTLDKIAGHTRTIIVVEESSPLGGLSAAIAGWMASGGNKPGLIRLGPPDKFLCGNPSRETLAKRYGYDKRGIIDSCRRSWRQGV